MLVLWWYMVYSIRWHHIGFVQRHHCPSNSLPVAEESWKKANILWLAHHHLLLAICLLRHSPARTSYQWERVGCHCWHQQVHGEVLLHAEPCFMDSMHRIRWQAYSEPVQGISKKEVARFEAYAHASVGVFWSFYLICINGQARYWHLQQLPLPDTRCFTPHLVRFGGPV